MSTYIVTTDGSCPNNGATNIIGGWACVIRELSDDIGIEARIAGDKLYQIGMKTKPASLNDSPFIKWCEERTVNKESLFGTLDNATNNRAELRAMIESLIKIPKNSKVIIRSDSEVNIKCINKLYKTKSNLDLWVLYNLNEQQHNSIEAYWIKGHKGDIDNCLADQLAVNATAGIEFKKAKQSITPISFDDFISYFKQQEYTFSIVYDVDGFVLYLKKDIKVVFKSNISSTYNDALIQGYNFIKGVTNDID